MYFMAKVNVMNINQLKKQAIVLLGISSLMVIPTVIASDKNQHQYNEVSQISIYSQAELAQVLAPIALYPDNVLSHILIAATYPLEVVEAHRWVTERRNFSDNYLLRQAKKKSWDESIKALVVLPDVLKQLNDDLTWMQTIGDAFLANEENVLSSIQQLRYQAYEAGNLVSSKNIQVVNDDSTIVITTPSADVIYLPYYDTRFVYGRWAWHDYPPVYWHRPVHYRHHHGAFYWRSAIHLTGHIFFSGFHWHNKHVVVHNRYFKGYVSKKRSKSYHGKRWLHNKVHRKGIVYHSVKGKQRVHHVKKHQQVKHKLHKKNKFQHNKVINHKLVKRKNIQHKRDIKRQDKFKKQLHKHQVNKNKLTRNESKRYKHYTAHTAKSKVRQSSKSKSVNKAKYHNNNRKHVNARRE